MDWITTSTILRDLKDFESDRTWEHFVRRFRLPIVSFARQFGLSASDAEDVAQETLAAFADAYRNGRYDRHKGRLSHWLFGIAYRQILRQRALAARIERALPDGSSPAEFWSNLPDERSATASWDQEWEQAMLDECLRRVQAEVETTTFRAFELAMRDDRTAGSVAEELGVPIKTVYNAKHRVLQRIRELRNELESIE